MRKFIIDQLTQSSTWFGILLIVCALIVPRNIVVGVGLVVMFTNDVKTKTFFDELRKWIAAEWPE